MEDLCNNWELCMNRDPDSVKRSYLSAKMFAETLNGFLDSLSLKSVVSVLSYHSWCLFEQASSQLDIQGRPLL